MENINNFIKMSSSIVRNSCISSNAKLIYALLLTNKRIGVDFNTLCVSTSSVLHMIKYKYHASNIKSIKMAIGELVNTGIISIYDNMSLTIDKEYESLKANDMFYVKFNDDFVDSSEFIEQFGEGIDYQTLEGGLNIFTSLYLDDVVKLIDADLDNFHIGEEKISVNKGKLFSVYAMILSRANIDLNNLGKGTKVSYEDIETISKYTNVSESAVRNYIKVLYNMKLIFKVSVSQQGLLRSQNLYGRWRDRNVVIKTLDKEKSSIPFNYYQLLRIGDTELSDVDATKVLMLINKRESYTIDNDWVDNAILKPFT